MKKLILISLSLICVLSMQAQKYTVISRNNQDTIKLYPNALGDAKGKAVKSLKTALPFGSNNTETPEEHYWLIKKEFNNQESLLFVEFQKLIDTYFVTYETDMKTAGEWDVKTYGFSDVFQAATRVNAILLEGEFLGMKIKIHQRPANFNDMIEIDNLEFPTPIKIAILESSMPAVKQEDIVAGFEQSSTKTKDVEISNEDIKEEEILNPNDCYIAYLMLSEMFNQKTDKNMMSELVDKNNVKMLIKKYSADQLNQLSKNHDKRLNKYQLR